MTDHISPKTKSEEWKQAHAEKMRLIWKKRKEQNKINILKEEENKPPM